MLTRLMALSDFAEMKKTEPLWVRIMSVAIMKQLPGQNRIRKQRLLFPTGKGRLIGFFENNGINFNVKSDRRTPAWLRYFQVRLYIIANFTLNLKSGVSDACYYEPEVNPTYTNMAEHYGCAVLPARPRQPRDKAKVEVGVLIAQRWILAVLRQRTFYSLADLNAAIRQCLERLNTRPLRQAKKSRREMFDTIDRPNSLPLPQRPYEYAEWYKAKVSIDYHIEIDNHFYSIPLQLIHERLDIRMTASVMEAFHKGERVAAHVRSYVKGGYTTVKEHMPPSHRYYAEWNPARFIQWAGKIGQATSQLVERILSTRTYPEQGYRACLGIIRLERHYEPARVEAAAKRALKFNTCSYRSMKSILSSGLDRQYDSSEQPELPGLPPHQNIRGQEYYQ